MADGEVTRNLRRGDLPCHVSWLGQDALYSVFHNFLACGGAEESTTYSNESYRITH